LLKQRIKESKKIKLELDKINENLNFTKKISSTNPTRSSSAEIPEFNPKYKKNKGKKNKSRKENNTLFKVVKEKKKYNDWNFDEDFLLLKLCKNSKFNKKWNKISRIIGHNKTPRMCSYRYKKLSKHAYINKNNELVNRKSKPGKKNIEVLDQQGIDMLLHKGDRYERKRDRIIARKPINRPCLNTTNTTINTEVVEPLDVIKKDSNISMVERDNHQVIIDYEKTLVDLHHLQINEDNNIVKLPAILKKPIPVPLLNRTSKESGQSKTFLSDLDIKSIRSQNSSEVNNNLLRISRRAFSPIAKRTANDTIDFKSAFKSAFKTNTSIKPTNGINSNQGTGNLYYYNTFETVKLEKNDYIEAIEHLDTSKAINELVSKQRASVPDLYTSIEDVILNSTCTPEEKNLKLALKLMEITSLSNEATATADKEDLKLLTFYQAKILEHMITLANHLK